MATAGKDKTVRLWNMTNLSQQPIELHDLADWVWCLAFSPGDDQLMVGLHSSRQVVREGELRTDESIRAYPTNLEAMSSLLCDYVSRNLTKEEWSIYVGEDIVREATCDAFPLD